MATSCCARRLLGRPRLSEVRVKGQAAVDEDRLPGDVDGVVASEERAHAAVSSALPARPSGIWLVTIFALTGSSTQARLIGVMVAAPMSQRLVVKLALRELRHAASS